MKTSDLSFDLPDDLIAQRPAEKGRSRLLVVDPRDGTVEHAMFSDLAEYLPPEGLLIMNDSRVFPARLTGTSENGGTVKFLLLERVSDNEWIALANRSKRVREGSRYRFPGNMEAVVLGREDEGHKLRFNARLTWDLLEEIGSTPLPPYIKRDADRKDCDDYQTVYAREPGSVAAPTAGLHFSEEIIEQVCSRGVEIAYITLHVGIGTFTPIRTDRVEDHRMHEERYTVPEKTAEAVRHALREGRKITAVGTTAVRALESWTAEGTDRAGTFTTRLFIYPGFRFRLVDAMVTNFHTPRSSLLAMVSAFAGEDTIRKAYGKAIDKGYRFFSYGDAMLIRSRGAPASSVG